MGPWLFAIKWTLLSYVGLILSAVGATTLLHLFNEFFNLELGAFLSAWIGIYHQITKTFINFLLSLVELRLPLFAKDFIVLYATIGGANVRAHMLVAEKAMQSITKEIGGADAAEELLRQLNPDRPKKYWYSFPIWFRKSLISIKLFFFWPVTLIFDHISNRALLTVAIGAMLLLDVIAIAVDNYW